MTIRTENGLVYSLTHRADGLHMTCVSDVAGPGVLLDRRVTGFLWPHVGCPLHFAEGDHIADSPIVESITVGDPYAVLVWPDD